MKIRGNKAMLENIENWQKRDKKEVIISTRVSKKVNENLQELARLNDKKVSDLLEICIVGLIKEAQEKKII